MKPEEITKLSNMLNSEDPGTVDLAELIMLENIGTHKDDVIGILTTVFKDPISQVLTRLFGKQILLCLSFEVLLTLPDDVIAEVVKKGFSRMISALRDVLYATLYGTITGEEWCPEKANRTREVSRTVFNKYGVESRSYEYVKKMKLTLID